MLGLLGWDPYLKTVIDVDDDLDITDDQQVLWALATRFQPSQDLFIVAGLPGRPSILHLRRWDHLANGVDATGSPRFDGTRIEFSEASLIKARSIVTAPRSTAHEGPG